MILVPQLADKAKSRYEVVPPKPNFCFVKGKGVKEMKLSEMENGGKAPSIAEGIEQLCLGEELTAVVASRLGWFPVNHNFFCGCRKSCLNLIPDVMIRWKSILMRKLD